ncbi:hypothetical protein CCACVL1_13827 [Corchorus capsularis]|uniref:TF-B3 domain-containing protein n=1 Tax=Corchorus capsularis TaxID=210143 RepID=A0A1R3I9F4_COCAP|nr:hypothetical protein CCACVL1_13827 [Corchorus capsularis]
MEPPLPPDPEFAIYSFCKTLRPSDTSIHGGLSVLKRRADECFPPLDMSMQPPKQELVAKDLHGNEWRFEHIFRGQPRRHLVARGWGNFVSSKRPVAGDAFVFLRSSATIVGYEDADPVRWMDSKWRFLKVRWDESMPRPLPERVSPWELEHFD